ncbi:hypothetical protein SAMN05216563_1364 [Phytobacter palmae]|nr:hypothetical protein SAMN05216563_1364 [Phytobacter palmae]
MTREFYNFKPKKTLYDGTEDGFYKFNMKIDISKTGKHIIFYNMTAKPIWEFDSIFQRKISNEISGVKIISHENDNMLSYKYMNLDVYVYSDNVDGCAVNIIVAAGESQPSRFKIILLGYAIKK